MFYTSFFSSISTAKAVSQTTAALNTTTRCVIVDQKIVVSYGNRRNRRLQNGETETQNTIDFNVQFSVGLGPNSNNGNATSNETEPVSLSAFSAVAQESLENVTKEPEFTNDGSTNSTREISVIEVTEAPSTFPSAGPSEFPSGKPSGSPSMSSDKPSVSPSLLPSSSPTMSSDKPSISPSSLPSITPSMSSDKPSASPSVGPSQFPTEITPAPSTIPSMEPTSVPSSTPSKSAAPTTGLATTVEVTNLTNDIDACKSSESLRWWWRKKCLLSLEDITVQVFEATAKTARRNGFDLEETSGYLGEGTTNENGMVTIGHGSGEQGSNYLVVASYGSVSCAAVVDINGRANIKFKTRAKKRKK